MSTATNTIEALATAEYKYGFVTRHRSGCRAAWTERGHRPPDLGQEERAGLHAGVAAEGLPALGEAGESEAEPKWANVHYPPIDYQDIIYYSAPKQKKALKSLDEVDPKLLETFEKLGISLEEQKRLSRRRGRRGLRQRLGGDHVQGEAGGAGDHLLLLLRGGAGSSGAGREVPRLGGALQRQLLRGAELGGLQRRLVLLHPEGRALPDGAVDLLPHQRRRHRPVRAHADHRRGGQLRELPGRLHRADARRETSCTRRSWS